MIDRPVYTEHALQRLRGPRAVTEADVDAVLAVRVRLDDAGNPVLLGVARGRRIEVVVAAGSRPPRTVWTL